MTEFEAVMQLLHDQHALQWDGIRWLYLADDGLWTDVMAAAAPDRSRPKRAA